MPYSSYLLGSSFFGSIIIPVRTYRERKEQYLKYMENEIVRLRTNGGHLLQETQRLCAEVQMLRNLLQQHRIDIPAVSYSTPSSPADAELNDREVSMATVHLEKNLVNGDRLRVLMPKSDNSITCEPQISPQGSKHSPVPDIRNTIRLQDDQASSPNSPEEGGSSKAKSPKSFLHGSVVVNSQLIIGRTQPLPYNGIPTSSSAAGETKSPTNNDLTEIGVNFVLTWVLARVLCRQ